jgi:signal peptidase I
MIEEKQSDYPAYETIEPATPPVEQRGRRFWRFIIDLVETLLFSALLFLGINAVTARIRVDGSSMEPTFVTGEFVLVNRLAYLLSQPKVGDVIVFPYPRDPKQEFIKRVIGGPGDRVVIKDRKVYVNGIQLIEPYIAERPRYEVQYDVPQDNVFVLGDNRNNSSDSHNWGLVPLESVVGKAVFVYWPVTRWGWVDHIQPTSSQP